MVMIIIIFFGLNKELTRVGFEPTTQSILCSTPKIISNLPSQFPLWFILIIIIVSLYIALFTPKGRLKAPPTTLPGSLGHLISFLEQGCQFSGYCRNSSFFKFSPIFFGRSVFHLAEKRRKKKTNKKHFPALRISSGRRKYILLKTDFLRSVFHLAGENISFEKDFRRSVFHLAGKIYFIENKFPALRNSPGQRKYIK